MEPETSQAAEETTRDGVEREQPAPSALDRAVALPIAPAVIAAALAILAALTLRLPELARWAVNPTEGAIALAARNLVRGAQVPDDMLGQPFVVEWVALFMFLGDTNETAGRVALAIAGVIGIVGILAPRPVFGAVPAIAAMALLAFSPTLIAASRSMDGGVLAFTLSVLLLASLIRVTGDSGAVYPALTGIALALLLLSGPLGLPAALIVALGYALLRGDAGLPGRAQLTTAGIAFVATFLLFSSALLTQPASVVEAPRESLALLWDDYLSQASGFQLVFWNLIVNEPLILLLAALAFVLGRDRSRVRALGLWAAASLIVVSVLGDAGAGGFALTILPIGLLAAEGALGLAARLRPSAAVPGWAAVFAGAVLVLGFAFISLAGLASPVAGRAAGETAIRFVLIVVIAIVPAGLLIARLGDRLSGQRIFLTALTAACVLTAITVRSATLTATEWGGQPGNMLSSGAMGDSVSVVVDRVHRISRDLTRTERDARMPVGGIGLRIALDEQIEQPFAWYFREYPNLTVFDPVTDELPEGTQLVLLAGTRDADAIAPGLAGASYVLQHDPPGYIDSPDWAGMAGDLFSLDGWRRFGSFLLHRETTAPVPASEFQLRAIPVIAQRFAIATGPFRIEDRAGIGSAPGQFSQPRGIAIDAVGGVYVVDAGNTRIQRFDPTGAFDQFIAEEMLAPFPGGPGGAGALALDDDGNLYVADTWNHQIKVYAPSGELLRSWGSFFDAQDDPALAEEQPGGFYGPRGLAIHDRLLYVTDTGNERVQVFTLDGEFVRVIGMIGSDVGQLIEPVGVAVATDGVVIVADSHNARISRFTLDGVALDPWPVELWEGQQFFEPYIAVGPDGRVYASDSASGLIAVFDATGQPLPAISDPAMLRPYDMAISSDGLRMYVTDGLANAVISVSLPPAS